MYKNKRFYFSPFIIYLLYLLKFTLPFDLFPSKKLINYQLNHLIRIKNDWSKKIVKNRNIRVKKAIKDMLIRIDLSEVELWSKICYVWNDYFS